MLRRSFSIACSPRGPLLVGALAFMLGLPSLRLGLQTDEHGMRAVLQRGGGPAALFRLTPEQVADGRQHGALAWWTSPELDIRFMRPLAAWTHALELTSWPGAAWAMHLVNVLLYALLAGVAALLYRRLFADHRELSAGAGMTVAAIAALLFAVNEAHAQSVGWISGRNTLMATLGALGSLLSQHAASQRGSHALHLLSAACLAFALASGEAGLSAVAYLCAHALLLAPGGLRLRVLGLAPHALVLGTYASSYLAFGYGAHGATWYRELSAPGTLLGQGLLDLPLWLCSQFGPSLVSLGLPLPERVGRAAALAVALPLLLVLVPALRHDRLARFFGLSFLLCLLPLFASVPQDRILLPASFAGFGSIAAFIAVGRDHALRRVRVTRRALIGLHAVVAPLLFLPMLDSVGRLDGAARALARALPESAGAEVVLVNAPVELLTNYARSLRETAGAPLPSSLHALYAGSAKVSVLRVDARTLELQVPRGWAWAPTERIFAARHDASSVGAVRRVQGMTVHVLELAESGMPSRVRFVFPTSLEHGGRTWLAWQGTAPVAWLPPKIGQRGALPGLPFVSSMQEGPEAY